MFSPNMHHFYNTRSQLQDELFRQAKELFDLTKAEKAQIRDISQFEKRRKKLKEYFFDMIGGLPSDKTPHQPQCTGGEVAREGYVIRNVVFQSFPGVYVTANLYLPEGLTSPAPAVLFTCGHIEAGKAAPPYQKVCIELVRNGFIVLAIDPISQGERYQSFDLQAGRSLVRWHAEHTYLGLQCELAGQHIVRYFVCDIIRAIDYLCECPEVDQSRIGVTGNSGGGIQTIMAMIADERISAAAPCTYITSREQYMKTGQPQDGEQIWDGAIREGMDYDDYISLFAPKPVLIGAVDSDFFGIEGMLESYEQAKNIYRLFGCEDQVSYALAKGVHGFNDELRAKVVRWFVHVLFGQDHPVHIAENVQELLTEKTDTLRCTKKGQVLAEYDDAISIHSVLSRSLPPLKEKLYRYDADTLKENVKRWLQMPEERIPIYPRLFQTKHPDRGGRNNDVPQQHDYMFFFSEENIAVGGIHVSIADRNDQRSTVWLHDEGVNRIGQEHDWMEQLLDQGSVFAFDPRGIGVSSSGEVNGRPYMDMFGTEYKLNCDARMIGKPLAGARVYDITRAFDLLRQRFPDIRLSIAASDFSCIYALLAGVVDDRVDEIILENMPESFMELAESRFYPYDVRRHWYGVLQYFDLPELVQAFSEQKNMTIRNISPVGRIVKW